MPTSSMFKRNYKNYLYISLKKILFYRDHSRCVYIPELKEMSLPSALFFGKVPYNGVPFGAQKRYDLKVNSEKLLVRTKEFVKECGGKGENFGIEFVKLFNRKFPEYLVRIYDKIIDPKSIVYQTPKKNDKCTKKIHIFFDSEENRFYWINKLAAFFNYKRYCSACDEFKKSKNSHKCCPNAKNANNADDSNDKSDNQKTESEESEVEDQGNDNLENSGSESEEDEQSENSENESEEDEQSGTSESENEDDEQSEKSNSEKSATESDDESEDLPPPKPPKVDHKKILGKLKFN